jgi:hypothetical protein
MQKIAILFHASFLRKNSLTPVKRRIRNVFVLKCLSTRVFNDERSCYANATATYFINQITHSQCEAQNHFITFYFIIYYLLQHINTSHNIRPNLQLTTHINIYFMPSKKLPSSILTIQRNKCLNTMVIQFNKSIQKQLAREKSS